MPVLSENGDPGSPFSYKLRNPGPQFSKKFFTGAEAATKKWRGLINIHDLTVRTFRIFERVD